MKDLQNGSGTVSSNRHRYITHSSEPKRLMMILRIGAGFTNDLRETLSYGELLKYEFYLIIQNFWMSKLFQ